MKRITALTLCIVCLFAFASCDSKEKQEHIGTDVEYYAKLGEIPEIEHKLGDNVDDIINKYEQNGAQTAESQPDDDENAVSYIGNFENGKNSVVAITGVNLYYDCEDKASGINRILSFSGGYGFENGALIIEVRKAMESYGHKAVERAAEGEELSLFSLSQGTECLQYEFEKNTVVFFFQDSGFCAISLSK